MTNNHRHEVPVLDSLYDPKTLAVVAARGCVIVTPPSGASFILPARADDLLCAAIRAARAVADEVRIGSATLDQPEE